MFYNKKTGYVFINKKDISRIKAFNKNYVSAIIYDVAIRPYVKAETEQWGPELSERLIKNKYLDLSGYWFFNPLTEWVRPILNRHPLLRDFFLSLFYILFKLL